MVPNEGRRNAGRMGEEVMRVHAMAAVLALTLAACDRAPEVETANASVAEVMEQMEKSGAADAARLEPGRWRVTARVADIKVAGLPPEAAKAFQGMKQRATTSEMCVRPEDAGKPDPRMFGANQPDSCRFDSFRMGGGALQSVMRCTPKEGGQVLVRTEGTHSPLSYSVRTVIEAQAPDAGAGQSMTMVTEVSGERIGPCDAPAGNKEG